MTVGITYHGFVLLQFACGFQAGLEADNSLKSKLSKNIRLSYRQLSFKITPQLRLNITPTCRHGYTQRDRSRRSGPLDVQNTGSTAHSIQRPRSEERIFRHEHYPCHHLARQCASGLESFERPLETPLIRGQRTARRSYHHRPLLRRIVETSQHA